MCFYLTKPRSSDFVEATQAWFDGVSEKVNPCKWDCAERSENLSHKSLFIGQNIQHSHRTKTHTKRQRRGRENPQ